MASTMLNEQGWNRDAIERQLAHGERDAVRAAYNYAQHLPERRRMMHARGGDYLDQLKAKLPQVKPTREERRVRITPGVRDQQRAREAPSCLRFNQMMMEHRLKRGYLPQ